MNSSIKLSATSTLVVGIIQFSQGILLAMALGAESYGAIAFVNIYLSMMFTFSDFGFNNFWVRKGINTHRILFIFYVVCSVFISFVAFLTLTYIGNSSLFVSTSYLVLYVLSMSFSGFYFVIFQQNEKVSVIAYCEIFSYTISFIYFIYFYLLEKLTGGIYFQSLMLMGVIRVISFSLFYLYSPLSKRTGYLNNLGLISTLILNLREGFSFAIYQMLERLVSYSNLRLEQLLIGAFTNPKFFGYYMFCWNLVIQPSSKIIPIFTRVAYPVLCSSSNKESRALMSHTYRNIFALGLPIFIGMYLMSEDFFYYFMQKEWIVASSILSLLSLIYLLRFNTELVSCRLLSIGKAKASLLYSALNLTICTVTLLISLLFFNEYFLYGMLFASTLVLIIKEVVLISCNFVIVIEQKVTLFYSFISCIPLVLICNSYSTINDSKLGFIIFCVFSVVIYFVLMLLLFKNRK